MPAAAFPSPLRWGLLLSLPVALSGAGLESNDDYLLARQALEDGLAAVAAVKADRLLAQTRWDSAERSALAELAVKGWLMAGDGNRVLEILGEEEIPKEDLPRARAHLLTGKPEAAERVLKATLAAGTAGPEERFFLAKVQLTRGHTVEARGLLEPLGRGRDSPLRTEARLMLAEIHLAAGDAEAALANLPATTTEPHADLTLLLRARALVALGQHEEAQDVLADIFSGTAGGEQVHHAAAVLRAQSLLGQQRAAEAVEALVQFLDNTVHTDLWPEAFAMLDQALAAAPALTPPPAALRWIAEGSTAQQAATAQLQPASTKQAAFQGHALLLAAQWLTRQQRTQEALGLLEALLAIHPSHSGSEEALRLALQGYAALRIDSGVARLAELWRQRFGGSPLVAGVTAGAAFERGDFGRAAALFQEAARLGAEGGGRRTALFNAAIAALKAGEMALYQTLLGQLQSAPSVPGEPAATDLELAAALDQAAQGTAGGAEALRTFVKRHPEHPRAVEARVALAEALLLAPKPDLAAAEAAVKEASGAALPEPLRQRLAYVRIWLEDKQGRPKGVTEAGAEFLKQWPEAAQAAEVRMKVADAYFRQGNFANAGTEFELVVREHADSPYADTALYFAGLSALSMIGTEGRETAISLWQQLAEKGGPLSIPARQQQAMAKLLDDKPAEALKLLDDLLKEESLSDELRWTLTCEKAEILIRLGKTEPPRLTEAINSLQALRANKAVRYLWHARAGHTLAWALNEAGRPMEALEVCYDVVRGNGSARGPANPADYRWYYRAGFFGIDLLKATKQWEAAARMAELLAQSKGERANEAKEQANTIRLEHFLWDGVEK